MARPPRPTEVPLGEVEQAPPTLLSRSRSGARQEPLKRLHEPKLTHGLIHNALEPVHDLPAGAGDTCERCDRLLGAPPSLAGPGPHPISRFFSCSSLHWLFSCTLSSRAASTCTNHTPVVSPAGRQQAGPAGVAESPGPGGVVRQSPSSSP